MSDVTAPLIIDTVAVQLIIVGLLAVGGVFVGYQGYRGYVRNDNRTLLVVTVGILFLTTIPIVVVGGLRVTTALPQSHVNIVFLVLTNLGLILILYAFTCT